MATNRAFKLDVGMLTNQDARFVRLIKYEQDDEGNNHSFIGEVEWKEYQPFEVIEPSLIVTGLDHFRITVEQ